MVKNYLLKIILLILTCVSVNQAQEIPVLITDRPDQTKSPNVVPIDFVQIETGFVYQKQKYTERTTTYENDNLIFARTLCRYGVNSFAELRFGGEYFYGQSFSNGLKSDLQGMQNLLFGAKFQLRKNQKMFSNIGIILQTILPFGNETLRPANFSPVLLLCFDQQINEDFLFGCNLGTESVDNSGNYSAIYSGSLGYSTTKKLGLFFEIYGNAINGSEPSNNFDCGVTYQFRQNVQVDFSLGTTLKGGITDLFGGFGISVRLPE